ncbi:MAG: hypothetical protein ACREBG_06745 [Pyrinomonadaceae bacterium]
MPEPEVPLAPPEIPPAPPEVAPAPEALDPGGVPWKNRASEYERKLAEATQINQQYQQQVGIYIAQEKARQQAQPPSPPSPGDEDEEKLDPISRKLVYQIARKIAREEAQGIAERTGYRFVQQAEHQNVLSGDPELYEEAKKQYATFKQHPMWAGVDDTLVQDRAIAQARAVMGEKRKTTPAAPQNRPPGVPPTNPGSSLPAGGDKQKWLTAYMAQPETLKMFKMLEGHTFNSASEQDRKALAETAEYAYSGTKFTGATGRAIQALQSGGGDTVMVEEV